MSSNEVRLATAFTLILWLSSSCGNSNPASSTTAGSTFIEASRAKEYHTIAALNADADAVVQISSTSSKTVETTANGVPWTITVATVTRLLRGSISAPSIKIRQLGAVGGPTIVDGVPLLSTGTAYLAFVQHFTYGPGQATDQYVVVGGGAGLFLEDRGVLTPLDPDSPDLPKGWTLAQFSAAVKSG
jgi:hypothetical protein